MRLPLTILATALVGTIAALVLAKGPAAPLRQAQPAPAAQGPVVVELFQSQGCSSCPPSNASLNAIADRPGVIALSFAVTYWDRLGWKDTFAKPAFTQRQRDYAGHGTGQVATPQMVFNGRQVIVGGNTAQVRQLADASHLPRGPAIRRTASGLSVGTGRASGAATVWLVQYDPRTLAVPVRAGENSGRTLPHRNVVRSLQSLGTWHGQAASFPMGAAPGNGYQQAVLIQQGGGGPIIAAAKLG
ncbi:MAG: DUF1223 domain-containing protein [Croceibacterium sp.]